MRRITSEILGAAMDEELKVAAADEELGGSDAESTFGLTSGKQGE
jgi:hypothetical protein